MCSTNIFSLESLLQIDAGAKTWPNSHLTLYRWVLLNVFELWKWVHCNSEICMDFQVQSACPTSQKHSSQPANVVLETVEESLEACRPIMPFIGSTLDARSRPKFKKYSTHRMLCYVDVSIVTKIIVRHVPTLLAMIIRHAREGMRSNGEKQKLQLCQHCDWRKTWCSLHVTLMSGLIKPGNNFE